MTFTGFTQETFDFFMGIRLNNDKAWFSAHRTEYKQYVQEPFRALAGALAPVIQRIDPGLQTDPLAAGVVSRIYRDTRFTHDKSPYRDHMWLCWKPQEADISSSFAFYVEIGLEGFSYGVGMYSPDKQRMDSCRARIDANPEGFRRIVKAAEQAGFAVFGQPYKKPAAWADDPLISRYYNMRSLGVSKTQAPSEVLLSAELAGFLSGEFEALCGIYSFLIK